MSKATLSKVRRMVYENLGITSQSGGYGNYKANERYPVAYVDDAIIGADLTVMKTLLKSKQYHFTDAFFTPLALTGTETILPSNIELLSVVFDNGENTERGVEIPWEMYEMFTEPLEDASIFKFNGDSTKKYGGYYSIKDHVLYAIPFTETSGAPKTFVRTVVPGPPQEINMVSASHGLVDDDTVILQSTGSLPKGLSTEIRYYVVDADTNDFKLSLTKGGPAVTTTTEGTGTHTATKVVNQGGDCKYIALEHRDGIFVTDLYSPQSFEEAIAFLASANLLMKRADNPAQSTFYLQQYQALMGLYMTPSTNQQRTIDQ